MKKSITLLFSPILLLCCLVFPQAVHQSNLPAWFPSKFSLLTEQEQAEAITAFRSGACEYKDIKLYGKVEFVESFPDLTIEFVESFPDLRVQFVSSFPGNCGQWQKVSSFPDFTVQVVHSFPDLKVKQVESFPGMD